MAHGPSHLPCLLGSQVRIRGGVDLILDAMARHEQIADLQSAACGLLWKIAFADPPVRQVRRLICPLHTLRVYRPTMPPPTFY